MDAESSKKKKKDFFLPRVTVRGKNGKLRSFKLGKKLGSGGYGDIFAGADEAEPNRQVAVKLGTEHGMKMLQREAKAYELFSPAAGIPAIEAHGPFAGCYVMVMEVLGQSLQDILTQYHYTPCAVVNIAIQALSHLEYIHSKHYIHGDIKPSNLLVGIGRHCNDVYLIDFGLAKEFRSGKSKRHIPYSTKNGFHGTPRYASIHAHQGIAPSRRDDLESLGYVLVYLLRGSLPWQSAPAGPPETRKERRQRITNTKMGMPLEELCRGQPAEFVTYLRIVRSLKFTEQPPYEQLRNLFVQYRTNNCGGTTDWFSTLIKREKPLCDDTDDQRAPPVMPQPQVVPVLASPEMVVKKARLDGTAEVIVISDSEGAADEEPAAPAAGEANTTLPVSPAPVAAPAAAAAAATPLLPAAPPTPVPAAAAAAPAPAPAAAAPVATRKRKGT